MPMSTPLRYEFNEDTSIAPLYFILDSSRAEPALKRVSIIMSASKLAGEKPLKEDLYLLANELMDVEQIIQKYVADMRIVYADKISEDLNWAYLLERMEDEPLDIKIELLNSMVVFDQEYNEKLSKLWLASLKEVRQFRHRFETLLFKLRTRYYDGSNRAAAAAEKAEEAVKKTKADRAVEFPVGATDARPPKATSKQEAVV